MTAPAKCQRCGAVLTVHAPGGLCPFCLVRSAIEPEPDEPPPSLTTPALPRAYGPYDLVEEIGRGGMGVVYAAKQTALGRTVAVKLLLSGVYSSESALRRFRREAAAAAGLQHPNIVAIHDYGEVDGQPYYAMDLVAGHDLAGLCAGRPLPARRAAELLRLLAGAVHYAHQRGVVHRDLKPSNVLIDEDGRPRIADFGLAKRLGAAEGATLTGQMLGSPSYAAPEQAAGRTAEIGTASDIYGLGALFYHLLTGRAPFNAATPTETLRLVLDTDPASPRLLNPSLPRDLETICLTCLAKEPGRRYATAAEVAADAERFLADRPIRARPPSALYRMRKFTRRHRIGVVAVAAVLLALLAGLGLALAGFRRAVVQEQIALQQKRTANAARSQAQGLIGFVMKDLQPDMRDHGRLQSQILTVEAAARYFDQLPPELRDEATMREQAAALEALADVYGRKQGTVTIIAENIDRARDAAQRALALRREIAAADPDNLDAALAVHADEARVTYNDPTTWTRLNKAFPDHIQKLRVLEQRLPDNPAVQRALAGALSDWAYQASFAFGKPAEARTAATESRERWQRLLAAAPDDKDVRIGYARSLAAMAQTFAGTEQSAQAVDWGEKALAYATQLLESDPTNLRLLPVAAETAGELAWVYQTRSPQRARETERKAREHYRMLMTLDPATAEWSVRYAQMHNLEIKALAAEGRLAEGRTMLQEVIKLLETAARDRATKQMLAASVATAVLFALQTGDAAAVKNEFAALNEFARARILALPEGSWERSFERLFWLTEQCYILDDPVGDWLEMDRMARGALEQIDRDLREFPDHKDELLLYQAAAQDRLGKALLEQKKPAEAVLLLKQAMAGLRDAPAGGSLSNRDRRTIGAAIALGTALDAIGDSAGARAADESALTQAEEELRRDPDDLVLREAAAEAAQLVSYQTVHNQRTLEAELIARRHCRILMECQPANSRWRIMYARTYWMGCYFFLHD
ncbi:MAG TPA: protein kinase, partial [Opitutaceae bacterium]|nr:protein kinase [Opitutaceae bacterium]